MLGSTCSLRATVLLSKASDVSDMQNPPKVRVQLLVHVRYPSGLESKCVYIRSAEQVKCEPPQVNGNQFSVKS